MRDIYSHSSEVQKPEVSAGGATLVLETWEGGILHLQDCQQAFAFLYLLSPDLLLTCLSPVLFFEEHESYWIRALCNSIAFTLLPTKIMFKSPGGQDFSRSSGGTEINAWQTLILKEREKLWKVCSRDSYHLTDVGLPSVC